MDERESLYFDTISLAESEAAAAAAHRKSLSQSRNTIYHSAVDLAGDETRNSLRLGADHMRLVWQAGYRQSTALEHLNAVDQTDAAIAAQVIALQNGRAHLPTGIGTGMSMGMGSGGVGGYGHSCTGGGGGDDEVSRRLLRQSSTVSNKDKKLPITYSQWKLRVNNQTKSKPRKQKINIRSTLYKKHKIYRSMPNREKKHKNYMQIICKQNIKLSLTTTLILIYVYVAHSLLCHIAFLSHSFSLFMCTRSRSYSISERSMAKYH